MRDAGEDGSGSSPHRRHLSALPRFAGAGEWRREVAAATGGTAPGNGSAVLFVDTFTRGFRPEVAGAAARR